MWGHGLHEHVLTSTSLWTVTHPQRAHHQSGARRGREDRQTPPCTYSRGQRTGGVLSGSGQCLAAGEHACSTSPVLRCQPSSQRTENNDAAGSKCAVPSTLP